ncbi:MAG: BMP family ABC transporter substrate-binding protein, partial [Candidatus Cloacimonetes bacterium]|nr:BMP family ABC transporter substrate-binding protein [Candidatus Cloacimonadota bacterium]
MKNAVYYILLAIILIAIYLLIFNPFTKKVNTRPMLPDYKVLVLFPGSITDQSWNQNGHLAFRRISEERGIDIQSLASVRIDDIDTLMVRYAAKKNLFVIGFGGEFTHALESVALKYPNIKFASWGKHPGNGRNLGSLCERTEVYYLAGAMAAMKSKSETVASIIGQELPHTKEQAHSFELGARSINPNIRVLKAWVGVWESVPLARKTAHELIENGAAVLYVSCDEA